MVSWKAGRRDRFGQFGIHGGSHAGRAMGPAWGQLHMRLANFGQYRGSRCCLTQSGVGDREGARALAVFGTLSPTVARTLVPNSEGSDMFVRWNTLLGWEP